MSSDDGESTIKRAYIRSKKTIRMRMKPRPREGLGCRNIFFNLFTENINRLEPIVYGFVKESECLLNLSRELAPTEREGITLRASIAKEMANGLQIEINAKLELFSKLKKLGSVLTFASRNRVRFM